MNNDRDFVSEALFKNATGNEFQSNDSINDKENTNKASKFEK